MQCAACGHNWFQLWLGEQPAEARAWINPHAGAVAATPAEPSPQRPTPDPAAATPAPKIATPDTPIPSFRDRMAHVALPEEPPQEEVYEDHAPLVDFPTPPRRKIDPRVLEVLRSEAKVEAEARRMESSTPLESQEELPLEPRPRRSATEVRARLAKLQEAERKSTSDTRWTHSGDLPSDLPDDDPEPEAVAPRSGFPPLPPMARPRPVPPPGSADAAPTDAAPTVAPETPSGPAPRAGVEPAAPGEVPRSRTLPAKIGKRELAAFEVAQARQGFRIGFAVPVAVVVVALGGYLAAPRLLDRMPSAEPVLTALISQGDMVQERLASQILAAFERLGGEGASGEATGAVTGGGS